MTESNRAGEGVVYTEWTREASGGEGPILNRLWRPEAPVAVLQIAHGMAEHSGRYRDVAVYLSGQGYAVCLEDHAGHGSGARTKGHFGDENGWEGVLTDMKGLMDDVCAQCPDVPVFLMGHSMGSFLARSYIARYGGSLSGCILMGTMGPNPAVKFGKAVAWALKKLWGPRATSPFLQKLATGGYNRRISHPVNKNAWISSVDEVAIAFDGGEDTDFPFTAAGYYDLFSGLEEISGRDWARRAPKALPILLLAGEEDPVGSYGKGPRKVYDMLRNSGHKDVEITLYPQARHELLNERNKEQVYQDILNWLDGHRC